MIINKLPSLFYIIGSSYIIGTSSVVFFFGFNAALIYASL